MGTEKHILILNPIIKKYQNLSLKEGFADLGINTNQLKWQSGILLYMILNNNIHPFKEASVSQTRRNIVSSRFKRSIDP